MELLETKICRDKFFSFKKKNEWEKRHFVRKKIVIFFFENEFLKIL